MGDSEETLRIGDGRDWHFVNGDWVDGEDGLLSVPDDLVRSNGYGMQGMHFAVNRRLCHQDCTVRFEISLLGHSDAGIILRARDESHFYLLHFPCCGQAYRAQHFWVALSKMDDSGYLRIVKMEMVRRVPSTAGLRLPAEVRIIGRRIIVRVGDYGCFEAEDDTYAAQGHVGVFLCSYGTPGSQIRNVVVQGTPAQPSAWRDGVRQPTNWFYPVPTSEKVCQGPRSLVKFPDGELLLSYNLRGAPQPNSYLVRSSDAGRAWSEPEEAAMGAPHLTPAGRLIRLFKDEDRWMTSESTDRARSWSEPVDTNLPALMPHLKSMSYGRPLNLADGGMLLFALGGNELGDPSYNIWTWGSLHCQAFASRSDDDGRTWSEPVNVDTPGFDEDGKPYAGNMDLTELSPMQLASGRVMVFVRPIYSPWMWETWSDDGGRSWGACVRGPFPGYATPNVVRTTSGALLVAHRLPWLTVHCSLDEGRTWQGTTIDSSVWAMGTMCEVEPDLVLYCYIDSFESLMRAQHLRVTPSGLEPERPRK